MGDLLCDLDNLEEDWNTIARPRPELATSDEGNSDWEDNWHDDDHQVLSQSVVPLKVILSSSSAILSCKLCRSSELRMSWTGAQLLQLGAELNLLFQDCRFTQGSKVSRSWDSETDAPSSLMESLPREHERPSFADLKLNGLLIQPDSQVLHERSRSCVLPSLKHEPATALTHVPGSYSSLLHAQLPACTNSEFCWLLQACNTCLISRRPSLLLFILLIYQGFYQWLWRSFLVSQYMASFKVDLTDLHARQIN